MSLFQCKCPACETTLKLTIRSAGKVKTKCPTCNHSFEIVVPASATTQSASRPVTPTPQPNLFDLQTENLPTTPSPTGLHQPRYSPPKQVRKAGGGSVRKVPVKLVLLAGGGLAVLLAASAAILFVDFEDVRPAAMVQMIQAKLDSPASVRRDVEELSRRIEATGRGMDPGDQSESSAERLLEFQDEFDELMLRACRLESESRELDELTLKIHAEKQSESTRRTDRDPNGVADQTNRSDGSDVFWRVNMTAPRDHHVTGAISKLTLMRAGLFMMIDFNIAELPDPFAVQHELLDWTDEDRRILATMRLRGQFKRDVTRRLASINTASPSESELASLHSIIDDYASRARELVDESGKNKMFAFVPKGTAYQKQEMAASGAFLRLTGWIVTNHEPSRQLEFIFADVRSLDEEIDELIFRPKGTPLIGASTTSLERFQNMLDAEAEAEREALAQKKREEQKREEEQRREEQRRKQEAEKIAEMKRKQEEQDRKKASEPDTSSLASGTGDNGNAMSGRGSRFGPGFGGRNFGPMSGPGSFGPSRFRGGPAGSRFGPGERSGGAGASNGSPQPPASSPGPNDVTIQVADAGAVDTREMVQSLPQWLRSKYPVSISNSNGKLTIRIQNYDRELSELSGCFESLRFEQTDSVKRLITATARE